MRGHQKGAASRRLFACQGRGRSRRVSQMCPKQRLVDARCTSRPRRSDAAPSRLTGAAAGQVTSPSRTCGVDLARGFASRRSPVRSRLAPSGSPCKSTDFAGSGEALDASCSSIVFPVCRTCARRGSARRLSIRWSQRADGVREAHSDRALPTFRANGVPTSRGSTGRSRRRIQLQARPGHPPAVRPKKAAARPMRAEAAAQRHAGECRLAGTRKLRRRYWLSAVGGVRREPIARCRTPGRVG